MNNKIDNLEFNRFGIISMILVIVTIIGAVAGASVITCIPLLAISVGSVMLTESYISGSANEENFNCSLLYSLG